MLKCFIIQPFDNGGSYDRRYDEIISPALLGVGFEAYRVDRDPATRIPIEEIERQIESSNLCLADITTDNPNVWYEVGFAFAMKKDVVLICSSERTAQFPFDIRHRTIIQYRTQSPSDFESLSKQIGNRAKALSMRERPPLIPDSTLADQAGLSPADTEVLALLMEYSISDIAGLGGYAIRNELERRGYTNIATAISVHKLVILQYLDEVKIENEYDGHTKGYALTQNGIKWIMDNSKRFRMNHDELKSKSAAPSEDDYDPFADE